MNWLIAHVLGLKQQVESQHVALTSAHDGLRRELAAERVARQQGDTGQDNALRGFAASGLGTAAIGLLLFLFAAVGGAAPHGLAHVVRSVLSLRQPQC